MSTIGDLIYRGVFDRFPDLRLYFAETQAAWLPHSLNWADNSSFGGTAFTISNWQASSEYVRQHCRFSFIADRLAMKFRYYIGLDLLMWGSDFPHSVGTYPHSRELIEELFEDVPGDGAPSSSCGQCLRFLWARPGKRVDPHTRVNAGRSSACRGSTPSARLGSSSEARSNRRPGGSCRLEPGIVPSKR